MSGNKINKAFVSGINNGVTIFWQNGHAYYILGLNGNGIKGLLNPNNFDSNVIGLKIENQRIVLDGHQVETVCLQEITLRELYQAIKLEKEKDVVYHLFLYSLTKSLLIDDIDYKNQIASTIELMNSFLSDKNVFNYIKDKVSVGLIQINKINSLSINFEQIDNLIKIANQTGCKKIANLYQQLKK